MGCKPGLPNSPGVEEPAARAPGPCRAVASLTTGRLAQERVGVAGRRSTRLAFEREAIAISTHQDHDSTARAIFIEAAFNAKNFAGEIGVVPIAMPTTRICAPKGSRTVVLPAGVLTRPRPENQPGPVQARKTGPEGDPQRSITIWESLEIAKHLLEPAIHNLSAQLDARQLRKSHTASFLH